MDEWPPELDALVAAPETHRLLFENEQIRVIDTRIQPGQTTAVHTHRWPQLMVVLSFDHFRRRDAAGAVTADSRGGDVPQPGSAVWLDALPPHTLENVGAGVIHVVGVELKGASG